LSEPSPLLMLSIVAAKSKPYRVLLPPVTTPFLSTFASFLLELFPGALLMPTAGISYAQHSQMTAAPATTAIRVKGMPIRVKSRVETL